MSNKTINLLQLYPIEMNVYGDWGNVLTFKKRLEWNGFSVNLLQHNPGDTFALQADIIVGGGGQDSGQEKIQNDLLKIAPNLQKLADEGTPMLMVCGLYQLFGHFFKPSSGSKIPGIGIFDAETIAGPKRLIGNIVVATDFGEVIGYENHSGLTYLHPGQSSLGKVIKGAGNNGKDKTEGAIYKNVVGSYLHGSLLPKNPRLADHLIQQAVIKKYGNVTLQPTMDPYTKTARAIAKKRPR